MNDLINREAALKAVNAYDYSGFTVEQVKTITDGCAEELRKLPAANAERVRPKGCAFCGRGKPIKAFTVLTDCGLQYGPSITATFCPRCGAKIDGENDG